MHLKCLHILRNFCCLSWVSCRLLASNISAAASSLLLPCYWPVRAKNWNCPLIKIKYNNIRVISVLIPLKMLLTGVCKELCGMSVVSAFLLWFSVVYLFFFFFFLNKMWFEGDGSWDHETERKKNTSVFIV